MKNAQTWRETKFVRSGDRWIASRDSAEVAPSSRLVADAFASGYASFLQRHARGRLLDHGCGKAPLYGIYAPLSSEVVTVDWAASAHGISHAAAIADLNGPMPFEDARFDTILSSDVVEHLANPQAVMSEFARVLADDGTLILGTPFAYWLHEAPHDYFRWSPYAIERLGGEVGLEVIEARRCGGFREVIADVSLKALATKLPPRLVGLADRLIRITGFASPDRTPNEAIMLGTITALRRKPRS